MTLLNANNQPDASASAGLEQALAAFKNTPALGATITNTLTGNKREAPADEAGVVEEPGEQTDAEELDYVEDTSAEVDEADTEADEEPSEFAAQFEANFGMKPDEAVSLVSSLVALRDEMTLMQEWGVAPAEYGSRMNQVREFYNTLPEDGREQFNSPEGAKVIWNHLSTNNPSAKSVGKSTRGGNVRPTRSQQPKVELIKRSDILAMDNATYQKNLPRITAAYREGRVLDNQ